MTIFRSTNPEASRILSEELEKKIEEVNKSMVQARDEAERFRDIKNKLDVEIRDLQTTKNNLQETIESLKVEEIDLVAKVGTMISDLNEKTLVLQDLNKQIAEAKVKNDEELHRLGQEKEVLRKRNEELDTKESAINIFARSLEDKEKKLDLYAERVKSMLGALKP